MTPLVGNDQPSNYHFNFFLFNSGIVKRKSRLIQLLLVLRLLKEASHSRLRVQQVGCFFFIKLIEENTMIKQYNFPVIFQNVVGDVVPRHLLEKIGQPYIDIRFNLSDENSYSKSSRSSQSQLNANNFLVKCKKKKLVRRSQFTKTLSSFTFRPGRVKENKQAECQVPKFSNFLRRKQSSQQQCLRSSEVSEGEQQSVLQAIEEPLDSILQIKLRQLRQGKRNFNRIRTSIDRPMFEDGILEESEDQFLKDYQDDMVSEKSNIYPSSNSLIEAEANKGLEQKPILASKKYLEKQGSKSNVLTQKPNKAEKDKKKTVFFAASPESVSSQMNSRQRLIKKGSIFDKVSVQKSSTKSRMHKILKKADQDQDRSSQFSYSTGKSVVSIKLDDNIILKYKKSLRSNQSILNNSDICLKHKDRSRTRTVKFIRSRAQPIEKRYKSQKQIEKKITSYSQYSAKKKSNFAKSKKSLHSQKSIAESKKKVAFQLSDSRPKGLVLRKQQSYLLEDQEGVYGESNKSIRTSKDVMRKNHSQKVFKTNLRNTIDNSNVYNQLNNFIRFFNEGGCLDSQEEVKKTFNKPIILKDQTHYRPKDSNRSQIQTQNLCIDMGLRLVRKMNKLAQKKI